MNNGRLAGRTDTNPAHRTLEPDIVLVQVAPVALTIKGVPPTPHRRRRNEEVNVVPRRKDACAKGNLEISIAATLQPSWCGASPQASTDHG